MSRKITYRVQLPNGTCATRKSHRHYSHAVIGKRMGGDWHAASYCGDYRKAQVRLAEFKRYDNGDWRIVSVEVMP